MLVSIAAPAFAARIVQVRIGNHPTFSRVVFELDTHTGYQIESRGDGNVLAVLIDADSRDRAVISKSLGVGSVSVEAVDGKSLVLVKLRRDDLMIKEMILSNPPRIVLDFEYPSHKSELASATSDSPAPIEDTPAPVTEEPVAEEPVTEEPVVAEPVTEEPVAAEPVHVEPEPVQPEAVEAVVVAPVVTSPTPIETEAEPEIAIVEPEPSDEVIDVSLGTDRAGERTAVLDAATPPIEPTTNASTSVALDWEEPPQDEAVTETKHAGVPVEKPRRVVRKSVPPVPAPSEVAPKSNVRLIVGIACGVLLIGGVALVMKRRGAIPSDFDLHDLSDEPTIDAAPALADRTESEPTELIQISKDGDSADATAVIALAPDNVDAGDTGVDDVNATVHVSEANTAAYSLSEVSANSAQAGSELFDEDPEGEKQMDMEANDLPAAHGEFVAPPTGAAANSDLASMVQELMTRLGTLETRLEESNEAREQLESQVAAQSEELRVQRAAIARTQRALRSLSRTNEDQATEPALRNPSA